LLREVNGLCSLFGFLEKQNCKKILFVSRSQLDLARD
jgi:hypothetical protein